ncbi:MAG: signal peptidase I [Candidatus Fimenecus sp.]
MSKNREKIKNKKLPFISHFYDFASVISTSVIVVCFVFMFIGKITVVNGSSMRNTLYSGERLFLTAANPNAKYGDIVVISQPNAFNEILIKRVVAVGGQTVDIDRANGDIIVDGKRLNEPYIKEKNEEFGNVQFPLKVPYGKLFVMGDNRNNSTDSRFKSVGLIDKRYIVGKAIFSLSRFKPIVRL